MILKNKNILIVSNEPWGDVWYSKHNWANELSQNNKVFFVNPPPKWELRNLVSSGINISTYKNNLFVLNYSNALPFTRYNLVSRINDQIICRRLKRWLQKNTTGGFIFWTFDPYRFSNPNLLRPELSIYFIADKYTIEKELELISNVDHIISVSSSLIDKKGINDPLILSHGISTSEFQSDSSIDVTAGYILYVGNIDYRLDYQFIEKLLQTFPNERFLFLGKINRPNDTTFKEIFDDKKYSNLIYHPAVHFKLLKNYIANAKICLAPMKLEVNGNNINHHKLLQYLALGKPVIAAKFKDYEQNEIMYSYYDHDDGVIKLSELTSKSEDKISVQRRIDFAKEHSYTKLITTIEQHISKKTNSLS